VAIKERQIIKVMMMIIKQISVCRKESAVEIEVNKRNV
jgi:hypothetical protein